MRRNTRAGLGAVAISIALAISACGTTDDGGDNDSGDGGGGGDECVGTIGFMGALSGSNASVVTPSRDGALMAFAEFAEENPDCDVTMQEFDTEGDPAKATPLANQIATNEDFIGVIGGGFSGESRAMKPIFQEALVTMISQSATATDLTQVDQVDVFHRVVGYDDVQGAAIANYIEGSGAEAVFVVDDSTTYGEPLATKVKEDLGDLVVASDKAQEGQTDFGAIVSKIEAAAPDTVFYAGYAAEAGPFLKQLRDAGVEATFVGGDGLYGSDFPTAAGPNSEGAVITCPCLPADQAEGSFAEDFEAEYGTAPGAYAAEGYDAANIFLEGILEGNTDRESMLDWVNNYEGSGITKDYAFDENGDVELDKVVIWAYEIQDGALVPKEELSAE